MAETFTFRGGLTFERKHKSTASCQIRPIPIPSRLSLTLPPASVLLVHTGDPVALGQCIAEEPEGLTVSAGVSGHVGGVVSCDSGIRVELISDGENRPDPSLTPFDRRLTDTAPDEIVEIIRRAGIVGLGGRAVPAYRRLRDAMGKAKHLIIDCAESEPLLAGDHRLLLEQPAAILNGMKILLKALEIRRGILAVSDDKIDGANALLSLMAHTDMARLKITRDRYPQSDPRILISAVCGEDIPADTSLPDAGYAVFSPATCVAVFRAFATGMPMTERVVTVAGDCVREPGNRLVPLGTSFREVIEACGGLIRTPVRIVEGGPMRGRAVPDLNRAVAAETTGILLFSRKEDALPKKPHPAACVACGTCAAVCPMHLVPILLARYGKAGMEEKADALGLRDCSECGACVYACPAHVPLLEQIRAAKTRLTSPAPDIAPEKGEDAPHESEEQETQEE